MTRLLSRTLLAVALAVGTGAGTVAATASPAFAGFGCVVWPTFERDSAPVFAEPTTASPQVDTITDDSLGKGCVFSAGEPYDRCGGGTYWLFVRNKLGYTPGACVGFSW